MKRGFPKHLGREVDDAVKELIKEGLLLTKPTSYGLQVSLDKDKLEIIDRIISKILGVGL